MQKEHLQLMAEVQEKIERQNKVAIDALEKLSSTRKDFELLKHQTETLETQLEIANNLA